MDGLSVLIVGFGVGCLTGGLYCLWSRLRDERRAGRSRRSQARSFQDGRVN